MFDGLAPLAHLLWMPVETVLRGSSMCSLSQRAEATIRFTPRRKSRWVKSRRFLSTHLALRRKPIEERKRLLAKLLRRAHPGIALNQHFDGEGATIFKHACTLGCEVSCPKVGDRPTWLAGRIIG